MPYLILDAHGQSNTGGASNYAVTLDCTLAELTGTQVGKRALANGMLCRFDPHWLAFGPPLIVTAEQIDEMLAILDQSIGEVMEKI